MEKKKNWELVYEKLKTKNLDNLIKTEEAKKVDPEGKLPEAVRVKKSKYKYNKIEWLKRWKTNLPKVTNLLELREILENQQKEINDELEIRKKLSKSDESAQILNAEMIALEKEYIQLQNDLKDVNKKLSNKNLSLKEKKKLQKDEKTLEAQIRDNRKRRDENNKKYKIKNTSTEELEQQLNILTIKVSKCNLVCQRLIEGYSWESVEISINKYENQRLTATGVDAEKIKKKRECVKSLTRNLNTIIVTKQGNSQTTAADQATQGNQVTTAKQTTELPTKWKKVENYEKKESNEHDDFMKYLKFVAENGVGVDPVAKAREDEERVKQREEKAREDAQKEMEKEIRYRAKRLVAAKKKQALEEGTELSAKELKEIRRLAKIVATNRCERKYKNRNEQKQNKGEAR